jgi:hypothetical protein
MKNRLTVAFLLIMSSLCLYAQQGDTTKIKMPAPIILQIKDSLLKDVSNFKLDPQHRHYLDSQPVMFAEGKMGVEFAGVNKNMKPISASYPKFVIPVTLISYGLIARGTKSLQALDHSTHNEINEHLNTPIPIDDYSQFAPAFAVYGLNFAGIKAKHNFRDRTIVMAASYLAMGATVQTMKSAINVWRPDNSNNKSFPSGHTATAFVGAHILFKEYKDVSPAIGVAGYAVATGTGALRVLNKKHWISDVVIGAGVGMLSAEAGYMLLPVFHKVLGLEATNKHLVAVPSVGVGNYGIGLSYTF